MDYTQILEDGNIESLKEIHDIIVRKLPCRYVTSPSIGKVVISHTDPQENTKTRLGEEIATYCEVEVDGFIGYGCIKGNNPERARYAAIIDSIIWNDHTMAAEISPLIEDLKKELMWRFSTRAQSKLTSNYIHGEL